MKLVKLTAEELAILGDSSDILYLEMIKGMSLDEMKEYDQYVPRDMGHFTQMQNEWLGTEMHLIVHRPNSGPSLTQDELRLLLVDDFNACHNGERFKVFYCLKFPNRVKRKD